jgi:hypothetical protein
VRQRIADLAWRRGGALGLAIGVAYVVLAPTHVLGGDNGEFVTLGQTGGIAHPSGYPLYVLYLRATSWMPGATAAHSAAIATALLGAAAMVVLHAACRAWGARPAAASLAVAIIAGSPIVLRMFTQAEVFALNTLVVATVLWLAAPAGPVRGPRRVILLGLVAGLGLANHLSCVFLAPVGVYGAVVGAREARRWPVTVAAGVGALVLGLAPYLYLLIAPTGEMSWRAVDGLDGLARHVLRLDYGGMGTLAPVGVDVPALDSIAALAATLARSWLGVGLALAGGGLAWGVARGPRAAWVCFAAALVVAGPAFMAMFNIPPEPGISLHICERFHLLPAVLLAVPVAVGRDRLAAWIAARASIAARRGVVGAVVAAGFAGAVALSLPAERRAHSPAVERGLTNMLESAPPDAVILDAGDHFHFAGTYLQLVRGIRRDVLLVNAAMMDYPWYRDRISARLGVPAVPPGPEHAHLRFAAAVLGAGRPLLVDYRYGRIAHAHQSYPFGMLVRVLPPGEQAPPIAEVVARNAQLFERFGLASYPVPHRADDWSAHIHWSYVETWRQLRRALAASGDVEGAAWARTVEQELAPR